MARPRRPPMVRASASSLLTPSGSSAASETAMALPGFSRDEVVGDLYAPLAVVLHGARVQRRQRLLHRGLHHVVGHPLEGRALVLLVLHDGLDEPVRDVVGQR